MKSKIKEYLEIQKYLLKENKPSEDDKYSYRRMYSEWLYAVNMVEELYEERKEKEDFSGYGTPKDPASYLEETLMDSIYEFMKMINDPGIKEITLSKKLYKLVEDSTKKYRAWDQTFKDFPTEIVVIGVNGNKIVIKEEGDECI